MPDSTINLGLHITKCAGTSLISTLRLNMIDEEYYFNSSYYEMLQRSRSTFTEISDLSRLKICFGHFLNENMLAVFRPRPIFLFTGLRDPTRRAISDFRQTNAVRHAGRKEPISAADYVAGNPGSICGEILRAFPSIAAAHGGAAWENALRALSLMDYVYTTERFRQDAAPIFKALNLQGIVVQDDNLSDAKSAPQEFRAFVDAEAATLGATALDYLHDDLALMSALLGHLGHADGLEAFWPVAGRLHEHPLALNREAFIAGLHDRDTALRAIEAQEVEYLVYEHSLLAKLPELQGLMRRRAVFADRVIARVDEYTMPPPQ